MQNKNLILKAILFLQSQNDLITLFFPENKKNSETKKGLENTFCCFQEKTNSNLIVLALEKILLSKRDFCFLNEIFVLHLWVTVAFLVASSERRGEVLGG